jgi:hypothetical protein
MSIPLINPEPPQPKGKLPVTDHLFHDTITRKYDRFRQPRLKFPSLIFLFGPQLQHPVLQYLPVINMNILPGNRTGGNDQLHQHQHLEFVIHLFMRLTHLSSTLAAPAPAASAAMEMIENKTALTFPGRNEIRIHSLPGKTPPAPVYFNRGVFQRSNTSNLNMLIETIQKLVKEIHPSKTYPPVDIHTHILTSTPAGRMKISRPMLVTREAAMLFPRLRVTDFYHARHTEITGQPFTVSEKNPHISRESAPSAGKRQSISEQAIPGPGYERQMFITDWKTLTINLLHPGKIEMTHPTADILPGFMTTHFYHPELKAQPFPGSSNIDLIYREPKVAAEEQPSMPGPAEPGTQNPYQWFWQDAKTYDMFINVNQRLLKKINILHPGKIEMSHPTTGILPGFMTTHFYHPELKTQPYPGSSHIDGIYREAKTAAGKQPSMPGPAVPGSRHQYQWFFQDAKTYDMFINVQQRLLKESNLRHPGKIEMSHPTTGILPGLKTTHFNRPVQTEHRFTGSPGIDGIYRESKPAVEMQPSKPTRSGPGLAPGQSGTAVPADTTLFDTAVAKRLFTSLVHFKKISHEENTIIKNTTVEKTGVDAHHLPLDYPLICITLIR